jgi:hypothetical protein
VLYTRNTIEYRDSTLAALVPAAVGIEGRVDDFTERRDRLAAERAIDDVLADSFPASDLPRGIRVSPAWLSTSSWHTARRDKHCSPMRASEVTGSATSSTFPGQRAEDGRFFKGWSPSLEQLASRWRFRS